VMYVCVVLLLFSGIATYYAIHFGLTILRIQDALEESLDVIDEKYSSISEICERPLFFDSPEVRQVLEDIKLTRASLHQVAYAISKNFEEDEDLGPEEEID